MNRTKTSKGETASYFVEVRDIAGDVIRNMTIFSTSDPKAYRKLREIALWDDDVLAGETVVLFRLNQKRAGAAEEICRLVVEVGAEADEVEEVVQVAVAA